MAIETERSTPLDYRSRDVRPPRTRRCMIVIGIGAVIALVGVIVFCSAHAISTPTAPSNFDDWQLREVLWAVFGITLLLIGAILATVGLTLWCRNDAG
jgi:hypothetical protein